MRRIGLFLLSLAFAAFAGLDLLVALLVMMLITPFHLVGASFDPGRYFDNLLARYAQTWEFLVDAL